MLRRGQSFLGLLSRELGFDCVLLNDVKRRFFSLLSWLHSWKYTLSSKSEVSHNYISSVQGFPIRFHLNVLFKAERNGITWAAPQQVTAVVITGHSLPCSTISHQWVGFMYSPCLSQTMCESRFLHVQVSNGGSLMETAKCTKPPSRCSIPCVCLFSHKWMFWNCACVWLYMFVCVKYKCIY